MTGPGREALRRKLLRPTTLRVTLLLTVVLVAGAGLIASGLLVTSAMERSLIDRIDDQLSEAARPWLHAPDPPPADAAEPPRRPLDRPPSPYYIHITQGDSEPRVFNDSAHEPLPGATAPGGPRTVPSATEDGPRWRILTLAHEEPDPAGSTIITVGMQLTDIEDTIASLRVQQAAVGGLVLLLIALGGYALIGRNLAPLRHVEKTAVAIADGQWDRRVPAADPRTEVGALGAALNTMLGQIQEAFAASARSADNARQSEDRMRQFIADASHELRTPLTVLRGFAELYRSGATDDAAAVLARIEAESERMGLLVEDLLMLARLDAQRPIATEPVDLVALCVDAVQATRAAHPGRTITVHLAEGSEPPIVPGDAPRLRQVLHNLLSNAIAHTPSTASINVSTGIKDGRAFLEVADTGPGIDPEIADRVFERFVRSDESRSRASGGTGLGLAIVASLIAAHQGTVAAIPRTGGGTIVRAELPAISQ